MDTCLNCEFCNDNREILCANGIVATAGGALLHGRIKTDNGKTSHGGWSKKMTANRHFVSKIPKSYPLEKAGPIFCAGITMYNPLKRFGADKGGLNVGIAGILAPKIWTLFAQIFQHGVVLFCRFWRAWPDGCYDCQSYGQ